MSELPLRTPIRFATESRRSALMRVLQLDYLRALAWSRWPWVVAVLAACLGFASWQTLKSPIYRAQVQVYDPDMNDQGVVTNQARALPFEHDPRFPSY